MELILFIYLKTKRMKKNWKNVLLYIVRIIELLITGAAGGALGNGFMRTVSLIIVHCSANKAGSALRAEDINRYHRLHWAGSDCGYHYVIPTDGTIEAGRPEELVGAHCKHLQQPQYRYMLHRRTG